MGNSESTTHTVSKVKEVQQAPPSKDRSSAEWEDVDEHGRPLSDYDVVQQQQRRLRFSKKDILDVPCLRDACLYTIYTFVGVACPHFAFVGNSTRALKAGWLSSMATYVVYIAYCRYNYQQRFYTERDIYHTIQEARSRKNDKGDS